MNSQLEESNTYVQGDKCLYKFLGQSTSATLIVTVPFSQFFSIPLYGRYFPLYSLLELSSPYTCSPFKPPLEQLSYQLSSSTFLNDNLPKNIVQRSTQHKCSHNGRYNAFNVEISAFLQIFWSLPSSQGVCEVFLRGGNFVEYIIMVRVNNLNYIQWIREVISHRKAFLLFLRPKILMGKSQQSLISYLPPRQFRFVDKDQDSILINLDSHKPKAQYA